MSRATHSVAMTQAVEMSATQHLLRTDRQEDICFALWNPSKGRSRFTGIVERLILPEYGDRNVHGNASFNPSFLQRALVEAARSGTGLALMHSHPTASGWQGMSSEDVVAEHGIAGAVYGATSLPLLGLTMAGDKSWSGRFWVRTARKTHTRHWCSTVRSLGNSIAVTYMDELAPRPQATEMQIRTISAWGKESQADLVRLRVGVIGNGSVGGFVAEALARTGFEDVMLLDFDRVEKHNLDRLTYATAANIGELKVEALANHLRRSNTAEYFRAEPINYPVFEEKGFRSALDCDVLFSCIDRPWGRHVLNIIAYAHLIPVIDGGIFVRTNRHRKLVAADWRAHTATIGRPCLQCLGQYDSGLVQTEREGRLDDSRYIEGLPLGNPLRVRENVFAFSMSCASLQILQMLALALAPLDQPNPGSQRYHFVGGFMANPSYGNCKPECSFRKLIAKGDSCGLKVTGARQEFGQ